MARWKKRKNVPSMVVYQAAFPEGPSLEIYTSVKRLSDSQWAINCPQIMETLHGSNR